MKMLLKITAVFAALTMLLCGCKGVMLDENETVDGNGTSSVVKKSVTYTIQDGTITADGEFLANVEGADDKLFALGEYLYVNTPDEAMQISIKKGKVRKFGGGAILAAKGRWIYYKSDMSKARGMSLYKIDMLEGREVLLFEGDAIECEENENIFTFTTTDNKIWTNELNNDEAILKE